MNCINIFNKTTMSSSFWAFEHNTDASIRIIPVDKPILQSNIWWTPSTDSITSPWAPILVKTVKPINDNIIWSSNLNTLPSRIRPPYILSGHIRHQRSITFLKRESFRSTFNSHIFSNDIVSFVNDDIRTIISHERHSWWTRVRPRLMHSIRDNLQVFNFQTMWFPAEKPSSAGRVVNHNIGDGHIFMANF